VITHDPIILDAPERPDSIRGGIEMIEDELREYCRGQIAHYKVPRYIATCTSSR